MPLNIPQSPILDNSGMLSAEWLIFFNQLVRVVNKLEEAGKVTPPVTPP